MNHPIYNELYLLIQNQCPVALCLQETHLKEIDKININYVMYNSNAQTDIVSGSSPIAFNNRYFYSEIKFKNKYSSSCNSSFSSQNHCLLLYLYSSKV